TFLKLSQKGKKEHQQNICSDNVVSLEVHGMCLRRSESRLCGLQAPCLVLVLAQKRNDSLQHFLSCHGES
ncbi:unnamed protein product, partial [Caenorhabditis brenneri]